MGNIRQLMVRGIEKVDQMFVLPCAAYNLMRMRTLVQMRRYRWQRCTALRPHQPRTQRARKAQASASAAQGRIASAESIASSGLLK